MSTSKRSRGWRFWSWMHDLFRDHPSYIPTGWIGFYVRPRTIDDQKKLDWLRHLIVLVHISNRWQKGSLSDNRVEISYQSPPHCTRTEEMIWFRLIHDNRKPLHQGQIKRYEKYVATLASELAKTAENLSWILKVSGVTEIRTKEHVFVSSP